MGSSAAREVPTTSSGIGDSPSATRRTTAGGTGATTKAAIAALLLTMAFATAFVDFRIREFRPLVHESYIPAVLDGSAEAPGRYRVLAPWVVKLVEAATPLDLEGAWHATRLAWFICAYFVTYAYFRTWYDRTLALAGTAIVAATLPLTFTNSWAHPDHAPELALFTAAALALARKREWLFAALLVLACLNRETAAFLVLLCLTPPWSTGRLTRGLLFGLLAGGVLIGLRVWLGMEHYEYWQFWRNVRFFGLLPPAFDPYKRAYAYFVVVLFLPMLLMALARWRTLPEWHRRALMVVPPFLAVAFLISSVIETRIFTPLYPLIMPAVLAWFAGERRASGDDR